ncbi:MAG TPA: hypothetical protein VK186_16255 [Candidatus Deferrimicrobium sp.]|nr:hypothetical protein [Candidatus Kapabacteria bacterium]HLP60394.1 hypothetical protein [Candidatus Deferrimicrobium sp.]
MEQIEVISWKALDALRHAATHIEEVFGDLDTNEQMAVFCSVEEDFLELYYSELEGNYIRRFEDEEEMRKYITQRRSEFGDEFDSSDYYGDESNFVEEDDDDFTGYKIKDEEDDDDF